MPRARKLPVWIDYNSITPKIERSTALRETLARLITDGGSTQHSRFGETVAYILRGLEEARVPYSLASRPGEWCTITVAPPNLRMAPLGG